MATFISSISARLGVQHSGQAANVLASSQAFAKASSLTKGKKAP